jgi:hypothetical protein
MEGRRSRCSLVPPNIRRGESTEGRRHESGGLELSMSDDAKATEEQEFAMRPALV